MRKLFIISFLFIFVFMAVPVNSGEPTVILPDFTKVTAISEAESALRIIANPASPVIGENIIARVKGNPTLIMPAVKGAMLKLLVKNPAGVVVKEKEIKLPISSGRIGLYSYLSNGMIEILAHRAGKFTFEGFIVFKVLGTLKEKRIPVANAVVTVLASSDSDDDSDAVSSPQGISSNPMEGPIKLSIHTKEGSEFIDEDVLYHFVADLSKVTIVDRTNPAQPIVAKIYKDYFEGPKKYSGPLPDKDRINTGQGGISKNSLVYRWLVKDVTGAEMKEYSWNQSKKSDKVDDFPVKFDDPTEPRKVAVGFKGDYETVEFYITYANSGVPIKNLRTTLKNMEEEIPKDNFINADGSPNGLLEYKTASLIPAITVMGSGAKSTKSQKSKKSKKNTTEPPDYKFISREIKSDIHLGALKPVVTSKGEKVDILGQVQIIVIEKYINKVDKKPHEVVRKFDSKPLKVASYETERQTYTDKEALMSFPVYDTTAPEIVFETDSGINQLGDYKVTTGDLKLVRVRITDNNRYASVRVPYLHYEVAPSKDKKGNWAGTPLRMETIDGIQKPPYVKNSFRWQAFVPVPTNFIGEQCVRWFVDAYDGSSHPRFQEKEYKAGVKRPGNHNRGKMNVPIEIGQWEVLASKYGTFSLYDNDRPNIDLRVYEVNKNDIVLKFQASAAEDYNTPDFYTGIVPGSNFVGDMPDDGVLYNKQYRPTKQSTAYNYYMDKNPDLKKEMIENQPYQIADNTGIVFKFKTPLQGENVVFEDKKYLFVLDFYDNVEFKASNTSVSKIDNLSNFESIKWQIYDPEADQKMETMKELNFAGGMDRLGDGWYLGPKEPDIDPIDSKKEVPMFEYVFHSPTKKDNIKPRLQIMVKDARGLERNIHMEFNVVDVQTEFKSYEGNTKRKRELKNQLNK